MSGIFNIFRMVYKRLNNESCEHLDDESIEHIDDFYLSIMRNSGGETVVAHKFKTGMTLEQVRAMDESAYNRLFIKALDDAINSGSDLDCADFSCKRMDGFNFDCLDLMGSDFTQSSLRGCSFRGANLQSCDFSFCDLKGADFNGAKIYGARFEGADLRGSSLVKNADGLIIENIHNAVYNEVMSSGVLDDCVYRDINPVYDCLVNISGDSGKYLALNVGRHAAACIIYAVNCPNFNKIPSFDFASGITCSGYSFYDVSKIIDYLEELSKIERRK